MRCAAHRCPMTNTRPTPPPLFTLRLLALLTTSSIVGVCVGVATWHASTGGLWSAFLAGATAAGVSLDRLHHWTEP